MIYTANRSHHGAVGSSRFAKGLIGTTATALLVLSGFTGGTNSSFTATVTNPNNTASTAPFFTCAGATASVGQAETIFLYPLHEAKGPTAVDTSGKVGGNGTYSDDGVAYEKPGPCSRDKGGAITLDDQRKDYEGFVAGPSAVQAGPGTFSVELWFNTITTAGGTLIGFSDNQDKKNKTKADRHVYMSESGLVYFGVQSPSNNSSGKNHFSINTTAAYNNGAWHHVAATFSPAAGMALYLDDQPAVVDAESITPDTYQGYWDLGCGLLKKWDGAPKSEFFAGSLAYAAAYSVVLTPTEALAQYLAGQ